MPRSVKYAGTGKESLARSYSSDEMEEVQPVNRGVSVQQLPPREGPRLWSVFLLSALASAAAVAAVGGVCALVYPILKGVSKHLSTLNQISTNNFIGTVFNHQEFTYLSILSV